MRRSVRWTLAACAGVWLGSQTAWADVASDRAALLEGVEAVPQVGVPGPLAVFGDRAFAVLTCGEGEPPRALVAAARFGVGRAVAFGHGGYLGPNAFGTPGGGRLLVNAARWAAGGAAAPRVWLTPRRVGLKRFFTQGGCVVSALEEGLQDLGVGDVVVWTDDLDVPPAELTRHVQRGGGLLAAVCPWGVQQLRGPSGFVLHEDLEQNKALEPMGLVFAEGYLEAGEDGRFPVAASRPDAAHAGAARAALGADTAKPADLRLLTDTVRALPSASRFLADLRERLPKLTQGPSEEAPFEAPRTRLAVALAFHTQRTQAPAQVEAAPGIDVFPGAVPADAPRLKRRLELSAKARGWHSTGLYVPAGEVVHLRGGRGSSWTARVGCHTDRLWSRKRWKRWPEVSRTWTLGSREELRLASPYGGLLYLVPGEGAKDLTLTVEGAVEAPLFDLADPASAEAWTKRRAAPGPWAELKGRRLILTVPSTSVRALDDPAALMAWWDRVVESHDALAQDTLGPRPERFVADVQISAGYMHSGYPVMTHLDVTRGKGGGLGRVLDLELLSREGSWGHFHELGHNRQESAWTFRGTGEVTCNLFTLYAMQAVVGIEPWEHPWLAGGRGRAAKHLAAGAPFDAWKKDPGLALVLYAEVQRAFGWEPFMEAFRGYLALPRGEWPRTDAEKRDQWLLRLSRAVKRDLGPFFERWGIPTSAEAREQLGDLEPWLPEE